MNIDNIIIKLLENNPFLVFIFTLLITIFYLVKDSLPLLLTSFTTYIKLTSPPISKLQYHNIFSTLPRVEKEISMMKFYTHGKFDKNKTRLCVSFSSNKCRVCDYRIKDFLKNDLSSLEHNELKNYILWFQTDIHNEYIKNIRTEWMAMGIKPEDVDEIVLLFEKFRFGVIQSFEKRINSIFADTYHKTNFDKVLAVLETWSMGIDLLPKDMSETFEAINGKFTNLTLK